MRRGGLFVVVGVIVVVGGAAAFFHPQWWQKVTSFSSDHHQPTLPRSPEEDRAFLERRVKEYWQLRVKNDLKQIVHYEHPAQQGEALEKMLKRRGRIQIQEANILGIYIHPDGEKADVRIQATYSYKFNLPNATPAIVPTEFTNYWQKEQGVWYHVLDFGVISQGRPSIPSQNPS
jgi:hypothetical protein